MTTIYQQALILFFLMSLGLSQAWAQDQEPDWKSELGDDIVEIQDGKMTLEEYALVKLDLEGKQTSNLQFQVSAEAPQDGIISRDNFINLVSQITYSSLLEIYANAYQLSASEYLSAIDIEQIPDPIGTPDFEINITATDAGLQIEFVNTADDSRRRVTRTWEEMYAK